MQVQFKFKMSVVALGVMAALGSGQAMEADVFLTSDASVKIYGNTDSSNHGDEGVSITSNSGTTGAVTVNQAYVTLKTSGVATLAGESSVNINSPVINVDGKLNSNNLQSVGTVTITGNSDGISTGEGVIISSNNIGTNNTSAKNSSISVLDTGVVTVTGTSTLLNATAPCPFVWNLTSQATVD